MLPPPQQPKIDIRLLAGHFHLADGFLADDGLMQADMIEHAAQGVFGVRDA